MGAALDVHPHTDNILFKCPHSARSLARSSPLFVKETFPVFIFNHSASTKFPVAIMARRPQRLKKILRVYLEFCVDIRNVTA
jgi:hypothetical protein